MKSQLILHCLVALLPLACPVGLGHAQTPAESRVEILEPAEWRGVTSRGIALRPRGSLYVVGLAYHPAGVVEVLLNGARTSLALERDGSTRFSGYVPVDSTTTEVEVRVAPRTGSPIIRHFGIRPVPADSAYATPAQRWRGGGEFEGQRWAVVIGVGDYLDSRVPTLRYADDDARAFHEFLLSDAAGLGGFESDHVVLLVNDSATYRNIRTALFTFLKSATGDDVVYIYFAGHGAPDPERPDLLYLLPYDTESDNIGGSGLPMDEVHRAAKLTRAHHMVVITDACHSAGVGAPATLRALSFNPINDAFLQQLGSSTGGIAILTASETNQFSQEGPRWGGGHGVFTWALLEALRGAADADGDWIVTLGEAFEWTRDTVERETRGAQIPTIGQTAFDRAFPMSEVKIPLAESDARGVDRAKATLTVRNETPREIYYLFMQPCGVSARKPEDALGKDETIASGASRSWPLPENCYDLSVTFADDTEAASPGVRLVRGQTFVWTLSEPLIPPGHN